MPKGNSSTFSLSLASDRAEIVCTAQRIEEILLLPKVTSLDAVADDGFAL